jgi:hypothetical protein
MANASLNRGGMARASKGDLPVGASVFFRKHAGRADQLERIFEFAFLAQP